MTTKVTTKRMNGFQKWKTMIMMALLLPISGALMAQNGTPINSGNIGSYGTINTPGEYYLSSDISWNLTETDGVGIKFEKKASDLSADFTLDLNGFMLNGKSNVQHVIQVTTGCTLTLIDSNPNSTHAGSFTDGLWKYDETGNDPISGGLITGGSAASPGGGGIHLLGGNLIMENGTIAGNATTSTSDGAGVRMQSANNNHPYFEMRGGKIYGNLAQQSGGAVYIATSSASSFVMTGGEISYNTAKNKDNNNNPSNGGGGGIYTDNGNHSITIQGGRIVNNSSPGKGSNIGVNNSSSSLLVTGGTITNNSSSKDVYFNGSTFGLGAANVGSVQLASEQYPVKVGEWSDATFPSLYYTSYGEGTIIASGDVSHSVANDWYILEHHLQNAQPDGCTNTLLSDGNADCWVWTSNMPLGDVVKIRRNGVVAGEYGTVTAAMPYTQDNDTIILTANTVEPYTIGVSKILTLTTDGTPHTVQANCVKRLINIGTGRLTLTDGVTLDANGSSENPRNVMNVEENGTFIMKGGKLMNGYVVPANIGYLGGAIQNFGTILIEGGEISGNTVADNGNGGAIRCQKGSITMSGGTICRNESSADGGAVFVNSSSISNFATMTMSGGEIYGNQAVGNGGAICANGDFNMQGGSIHDNTSSSGNGGGVYFNRMSVISGGTIENNQASNGGGIYVGSSTLVARFTGVTIQNNVATTGKGNGVFSNSSKLGISGQVNLVGNGDLVEDLYLAKGITLKKDGPLTFDSMDVVFYATEEEPVTNGRKLLVGGAVEVVSDDLNKFSASPIPDGSALKYNSVNKDLEVMSTTGTDYVTVTFLANGGTGTMDVQYITNGVPTALNSCGFSNGSTPFNCWKDGNNEEYVDQQVVTLTSNLVLTAQWGINANDYIYFDLAAGDIIVNGNTYSGSIYKTENGVTVKETVSNQHLPSNHYYVYQSTEANRSTTGLVDNGMVIPSYESVINHGEGIIIVDNTNVQEVIEKWNEYGIAVGRDYTSYCISVTGGSNYDFVLDNIWSNKQQKETGAIQPSSLKVEANASSNLHATFRLKGENRLAKVLYASPEDNFSNTLTFTSTMGNGSDEGILVAGTVDYGSDANYWSSAIGGCNYQYKSANGLVFNGGTVYALATPGDYCVAIGGGSNGYGGVTINGGTVTAVSSTTAIGGGAGETNIGGNANIVINGGKVYAYNLGGVAPEQQEIIPCAAIGGGSSIRAGGNAISHVEINGGEVYAESHGGVGIGGGSSSDLNGGPVSIRINGGEITAKSFDVAGLPVGTGIGGGTGGRYGNGGDAILYITGGTINTGSVGGGGTSNTSGFIGAANVEISGEPIIKAQFLMQLGSTTHCSFNMSGGTISGSHYNDTDFVHLRSDGGAVWMDDEAGEVTISGGTITDCSAENGGAVYMSGGEFTMSAGTIQDCNANNGGGFYVLGGQVKVKGGTISENAASQYGGGFYVNPGSDVTTIINSDSANTTISGNQAQNGAGAYIESGTLEFGSTSGNFTTSMSGNEATTSGGGVYIKNGTVNVNSGAIAGNTTNGQGGGIYMLGGRFNLISGNIGQQDLSNSANTGGGIFLANSAEFNMEGGSLSYNSSTSHGAGAYVNGGEVSITGGIISNNSASQNGGGIFASNGTTTDNINILIKNTVIEGNQANENSGSGGGIYAIGDNTKVEIDPEGNGADSTRFNNNSAAYGGGLYAKAKTVTVNRAVFLGNLAKKTGGGVYVEKSSNNTDVRLTIVNSTIDRNDSKQSGGGVAVNGGLVSLNSTVIKGNKASTYGAGVYATSGNITIDGGEVANNKANQNGGGVFVNQGESATTTIQNKANIHNNEANNGGGIFMANGTLEVKTEATKTEQTSISSNSATTNGGGVFVAGGTVNFTDALMNGNTAGNNGGGIFVNGTMTFSGGTFSDNYAAKDGGGIYIANNATLNLQGSATLTGNHVPSDRNGGGVYMGGTLNVGGGSGVQSMKCATNYVGAEYSLDKLNNIFLPRYETVIHLLSDISSHSKDGDDTSIGFTVPTESFVNGIRPVIEAPEGHSDWVANLMPNEGSWGSVFDDQSSHIAVHETFDPFNALQIFLIGCWTTQVSSDPETVENHANPDNANYYIVNKGQSDETWHIKSKLGLAWFTSYVNNLNECTGAHRSVNAVLENDIDMSENIWVPIGSISGYIASSSSFQENGDPFYSGTFDGQGHIIKGIQCAYLTGIEKYGLFGALGNSATVTNTFVDGYDYTLTHSTTTYKTGGIAGVIGGGVTISNCEARGYTENNGSSNESLMGGLVGSITGTDQQSPFIHSSMAMPEFNKIQGTVGGIAGNNDKGRIFNSFANVKFTGTTSGNIGGLVGTNTGTLENCYVHPQEDSAIPTSWFAASNTGTIRYCYAPTGATSYTASGNGTLTGHGTYGPTLRDAGSKYRFAHCDQQIVLANQTDDNKVVNGAIDDDGNIYGLVATLNNWVEAQNDGVDYSTWTRTMASPINDDYPILEFNDFVCAGSTDGVFITYKDDLDEMIAYVNGNTAGGSIYPYNLNSVEVGTSTNSNVRVYIPGDMAIVPNNDDVVINARVGVTLDNSSTGFMAYDWHMFSPALTAAPLGLVYHSNNSSYYIYNHYSELSANGIESSVYNNAANMNPPATTWNNEAGHIGYFPTDTPYGYPYTTNGSFDFYCLDENTRQWINFKREGAVGTNSSTGSTFYDHWNQYTYLPTDNHKNIQYENETELVPGKGYMVALSEPSMLMADGVLNNGTVEYIATYYEGVGNDYPLRGVNLVGNPFQSYLDADLFLSTNGLNTYYILDADAKGYIARVSGGSTPDTPKENVVNYEAPQYIHPHQGFLVMVPSRKKLEYTKAMRKTTGDTFRSQENHYPMVSLACTDAEGRNDFATVELDRPEQGGGEKVMGLHAGDASLWFHFDDTDYQTAFTTPGLTSAPLRFKAYEDGTFTLRWGTANGEFNYLHLIDNMTGMDIDCLTTESYSFEGKTDDYTSRFKLVFGMPGEDEDEDDGASTGSATFAFQMGDELVVNGEGMLQMFDVNGRCLMSTELYGQQNTISLPTAAAGVYVLRLTSGENVKVQKMVVR